MFLRVKKTSGYEYLQIVESKREGVKIRQRVIGTIGRIEELKERGQIDQLLKSLVKYSERALLLLTGVSDPEAESKKIGPVLIFERIWKQLGIGEHIAGLLRKKRYSFEVERAIFITVLHRLMCSGSDRQAEKWQQGYKIEGANKLKLHHLYRAMARLGSPLCETDELDSGAKAPRCIKDEIEEKIFNQRRDLFTGMDLVFFDTTSIYFEGDGGSRYRVVRAVKNRYGAVNELGVFAMTDKGLREVNNPSAIFLSRHEQPVAGSVVLVTREGTRPLLVEVQALVDPTQLNNPRRVTVGLEQNRLSMLLAVLHRHGGVSTYDQDVFVNVVGGVRISETGADLPVLMAILSSLRDRPLPDKLVTFGEVGLSGEIRPVQNGPERLHEAVKHGFTLAIVPRANCPKSGIDGLEIIPVTQLGQVLEKI